VARPTHLTGGLPVLPRAPRQVRRPGARSGADRPTADHPTNRRSFSAPCR